MNLAPRMLAAPSSPLASRLGEPARQLLTQLRRGLAQADDARGQLGDDYERLMAAVAQEAVGRLTPDAIETMEPAGERSYPVFFEQAFEGLQEYHPNLLTPITKDTVRAAVQAAFDPDGSDQAVYERLRDAIEAWVRQREADAQRVEITVHDLDNVAEDTKTAAQEQFKWELLQALGGADQVARAHADYTSAMNEDGDVDDDPRVRHWNEAVDKAWAAAFRDWGLKPRRDEPWFSVEVR